MVAIREVELRKRRLDAIFERAAALGSSARAEELQADYARHICVLVSGFVEKAVSEIVVEYASSRSAAQVRAYVESTLRRLTNVDRDRLLNLVGYFDASWRVQMEAFIVDERTAAINSIVGLRNDIAHGGASSLSLKQVETYWRSIQEIVDKLADLLLSDPRGYVITRARRR